MPDKRMNWANLLKPMRIQRGGKACSTENLSTSRSPFQKDQDKILFSSAFRRLSRKTQVHPLIDNDHIHSRLTHSLEVSSVGRSLGMKAGDRIKSRHAEDFPSEHPQFPVHFGEIVQAACLAHDIGNPPFGHAGEDAIRDWFRLNQGERFFEPLSSDQRMDFRYYEGNAMGFRILTQTEYDTFEGGMRLTFPTLGAMLKYPWTSIRAEQMGKKKFSCFKTETEIFNKIASELGLIQKGDDWYCRHPLTYLVEAADDLCYLLLDLEDARELRILDYKTIAEIFSDYHREDDAYATFLKRNLSDRRKLAFIRGKTMEKAIKEIVESFLRNYEQIMRGGFESNLIDTCDEDTKAMLKRAKTLCKEKVYKHHRKTELEIGAYTALGAMLANFCTAAESLHKVTDIRELPFKDSRIIDLLGVNAPLPGNDLYDTIMLFLDYMGGMTDNFATHISQQILGKGARDVTR